jgi:hypothetical protein
MVLRAEGYGYKAVPAVPEGLGIGPLIERVRELRVRQDTADPMIYQFADQSPNGFAYPFIGGGARLRSPVTLMMD